MTCPQCTGECCCPDTGQVCITCAGQGEVRRCKSCGALVPAWNGIKCGCEFRFGASNKKRGAEQL